MAVRVVHVGQVRMRVPFWLMAVPVGVRLARWITGCVRVLVMSVVRMGMGMLHSLVFVLVVVAFAKVQPDAQGYEQTGSDELQRDWLAQDKPRHQRADERRGREIGAGARCAEMAQGQHEQDEAHAVADEADEPGNHQGSRRGQGAANPQAEQEIDRARDQTFELHDLQWVGERDLARQIVVEAPGDAGADDSQRPKQAVQRRSARPGQNDVPATRQTIPSAIRLSKFSWNTNQASSAVATPSMVSSREADVASVRESPNISRTGPTMPPATIAPASHGISAEASDASAVAPSERARRRIRRKAATPMPAPQ